MVKVSLIVPVFNTEKYLRKCLDSLISQTLRDIEIVCINDGSTDSSPMILAEYAKRDARIRVVSQPNSGLSAARNAGLREVSGEYLLFMDSDDWLEATAAERLYERASKGQLDLLFYNADCFADSHEAEKQARSYTNYYRRSREYGEIQTGADLIADMRGNGDYLCSACFELWRTEFLRGHGLSFTVGILHEDTDFTFRAALLAERAAHMDVVFFHRRVRAGSIMSSAIRFASSYGAFRAFLGMECAYRRLQEAGRGRVQLLNEMNDVLTVARLRYAQMGWEERRKRAEVEDAHYRHLYQVLVADPMDRTMAISRQEPSETRQIVRPDGNVKVSVIIPVYNMGSFVAECLDSVLGQTLREIEVICVDDGSTDDSPKVLAAYAAKDPRMKVITQANQGAFAARNHALDVAKGEFVIFMDPDDWYCDADALRTLYVEAVANKVKICGAEIVEMLDRNTVKPLPPGYVPSYRYRRRGFFEFSEYQYFGWYTRFIFDRMMLEENHIRFPPYMRYQDPPFLVRAMLAAGRFYALKRTFYAVRVEHKTINWKTNGCRKLIDFMAGNSDIFRMARENGMVLLAKRQKENLVSTGMLAEVLSNLEVSAVRNGLVKLLDSMGTEACVDILGAMQSQIAAERAKAERAKAEAGAAQSQSTAERTKVAASETLPLKPKSKKIAGIIARTVQCYRDEGLLYTIKRMLVLGRK